MGLRYGGSELEDFSGESVSDYIEADWPAPANIRTLITTRQSGVSQGVYGSNNLALHVADDSEAVQSNRRQLAASMALSSERIQWLSQIHGARVVTAAAGGEAPPADACMTTEAELACAVLTADCLPVLLCDREGAQVAAVHAGWRGLAAGILAEVVARFHADSEDLLAYLGPAIGPAKFEVGVEVLEDFFAAARSESQLALIAAAFVPASRPLHFYADLYALARAELTQLGVKSVYGGDYCTYSDVGRFYSYRRDGETGRMASLIWRK